jgi:hypothetical protein
VCAAIARLSGSVSEIWLSPLEALQQGAQTIALGANGVDFRGEVRHTRAAARSALLDVTGVQLP